MLPPSWKSEIDEAIQKTADAHSEQWKVERDSATAQIVTAIKTLSDTQGAQTASEDRNDKKNRTINVATLGFVFLTAIFTGLSWCAFRDQLDVFKDQLGEMQKVYPHVKESADAAKTAAETTEKAFIAGTRAWVVPRNVEFDDFVVDKPIKFNLSVENIGRETRTRCGYPSDHLL